MLTKYIFGSHAICLCYDITDEKSFNDLSDWKDAVDKTFKECMKTDVPGPKIKEPKIFLLGNKADMAGYRQVTDQQHNKFISNEHLANGFYVSAKSGEMISTVFHQIAAIVFDIPVTKEELEYTQKVLTATIICDDNDTGDLTEEEKKMLEEDERAVQEQQKQIQAELEREKNKACCIIQ